MTVILLAYLLGSLQPGLWIGQTFFKKDIREHGSGNTGTTNTFRVLGKTAGIIVLILDMAKGSIATLLPIWFGVAIHPMLAGAFAIIGHVFSIFIRFKGGKAVATSAGVVLAVQPILLLGLAVVWVSVLYLSSMVSLASILTLIVAAIASLFVGDWVFTLVIWIAMIIVFVRHRSNIERIKNGEENKVSFGLGQAKK
ncbi:glycerol-3-phosphate 1-O-acyltransferase PlsY [Alkalibacterium iburiense]|uniref:glycerol-3-phosphate 1-O-acyltransferase PlsY n=1 Tax=Alkalibacterium iburiense TaxID=290589 RepID=UPI0031D36841